MFHVGNARSLLLNWVVARQSGGTMVLRIEDTDAARSRPEWTEGIVRAMAWLGVDDSQYEGPYFQTDYAAKHAEAAQRLFKEDLAYYCDCTREQVRQRRDNPNLGYDGFCRNRGLEAAAGRALRFRIPEGGTTVVEDQIRGRVEFPHAALEDFVIARGDGSALFVLANVVDDAEMGITHVIRGEEHLSNTPKQQLLWQALGYTPPVWAHAPVLVNDKRQKLSKRRDKVAMESYQAEGFLPEAMVNYLMLLGWAPGEDREIMPLDQMVPLFDLADVNSSPAFFDEKKLRAFNGEYIRALDTTEFIERCTPCLRGENVPWPKDAYDAAVFARVAPLAQSRISVLGEIVAHVDFLFLEQPVQDEKSWAKAMQPDTARPVLVDALDRFSEAALVWDAASLKSALEEVGAVHGLKLGKAQAPVRVAVTGRTVGLPLFESLELLGRDRTLRRIQAALDRLNT